jgi:hypothetical protein
MTTLTTTNVPQDNFPPNWLSRAEIPRAICRDMHEAATQGDVSNESTAYKTLLRFLRTDEERTLRLLNLWVTGCTKSSGAVQHSEQGIRPKLQRVVSALAEDTTLNDQVRGALRVLSGRLFGPTNEPRRRIISDEYVIKSKVRELADLIGSALKQKDISAIGKAVMTLQKAAPQDIWAKALGDPAVGRAVDRMSAYRIWSPTASLEAQVEVVSYLKDSAKLPFSELTMRNLTNTFTQAVASIQRPANNDDITQAQQRFALI